MNQQHCSADTTGTASATLQSSRLHGTDHCSNYNCCVALLLFHLVLHTAQCFLPDCVAQQRAYHNSCQPGTTVVLNMAAVVAIAAACCQLRLTGAAMQ